MAENTLSFVWLIALLVLPVALVVRGVVVGGRLIATLERRGPCTRVERRPGCTCNHCRGRCLCASRAAAQMRAGVSRNDESVWSRSDASLERAGREHAADTGIGVQLEAQPWEQAQTGNESVRLDREVGDVGADVLENLWWEELLHPSAAREHDLRVWAASEDAVEAAGIR